MTDDDLCTFCSDTRPPLPGGLAAPALGAGSGPDPDPDPVPSPGGWGVGTWPRSPVGLSRAVIALLGCVIASDLIVIGAGLHLRGLWEEPADESLDSYTGPGLRAQELYDLAGTVQTSAFLASGVLFIIWFHRTRRNAEVFEPGVQRMGPGWAVGGWFVPVANLWFPYRVASGIWEASVRLHPDGGWRTVPKTVLNLWWGGWIVSVLASRIAVSQWNRAQEPEEISDAAALVAAADALDLVAAVLAIAFVRAVTRMQVERAGIRQAATAPAPAAP
ncbi:DUF4328 domain-containing protein [Streptomyces anulatus]